VQWLADAAQSTPFQDSLARHDPDFPARAHLAALDGLRGLAVLVVLASHYSSGGLLPQPGLHGVGKSGVYLFFVLSAFLLTRNLLRQPAAQLRRPRLWLDYALRRVLRIWPLYLVVLLLSWLFHQQGWPGLYSIDSASLWRHLSLQEGQSVLWSIPVEFTFYLWLPLIALGLQAMAYRQWPAAAQVVMAIGVAGLVLWQWPPAQTQENDIRLGPYLVVFLCGAFAARVDQWQAGRAPQLALWGALAVLAVLAWCVAIPMLWCWLWGLPFQATVSRNWFVFFGVLWSCLLLGVLHGPAWLRACFSWAGIGWVGRISFSLYLWHMPVIWLLQPLQLAQRLPALAAMLVLGASLLLAWLSYWLVERPLSRVRLDRATVP